MAFPIAERRTGIVHLRTTPKCSKKRTIISFLLRIATAVSIGVAVLSLWWRNSFQLANRVKPDSENFFSFENKNAGAKGRASRDVKMISLLGERNSGTRWISSHLKECFSSSVKVEHRLVRHKHWFQQDILPQVRIYNKTLVIALFRDPIDWVDAMRRRPHHAPSHYQKHWSDFVQIPWTLPTRPDLDVAYIERHQRNSKNRTKSFCHENFQPHQLLSCIKYPFPTKEEFKKYLKKNNMGKALPSFSGNLPRYELKENGQPYASILEMRRDKIRNFLSIKGWDWILDVHVEQYERLLREGTSSLIAYIESITGLSANCTPVPPQVRPSNKQSLDPDFIQWMNRHVDWNVERLIGYTAWEEEDAIS